MRNCVAGMYVKIEKGEGEIKVDHQWFKMKSKGSIGP